MKKFKRIKNDPLQIIGSIVAVIAAWFIGMAAVKYFQTGIFEISFFGLISGNIALAIWIVLFIAGLVCVLITQPPVRKMRRLSDEEKEEFQKK